MSPLLFDPLSANVEYARHDADITCSSCSAAYRQNHYKWPACF